MAVWSQAWYVVAPLVLIILGHWSLLLHGKKRVASLTMTDHLSTRIVGILLTAAWIPGQGCAITNTSNTILAATFIYSMCFDFIVLTLTAVRLGITKTQRQNRSKIVLLIFDDGLIYFIVA